MYKDDQLCTKLALWKDAALYKAICHSKANYMVIIFHKMWSSPPVQRRPQDKLSHNLNQGRVASAPDFLLFDHEGELLDPSQVERVSAGKFACTYI